MNNKQKELADAVKRYNNNLTARINKPKNIIRKPVPQQTQTPQRINPIIPKRRDFWDWLMDHYIVVGTVITVVIFVILCVKGSI